MNKDIALLLLRLLGLALAFGHGWAKVAGLASGGGDRLVNAVAGLGFPMPAVFAWAAGLSEFLGGLLIAAGLAARVAAGFASFTMFVAAFLRHRAHLQVMVFLGLTEVPKETLDGWGNPELALSFLAAFLTVALLGAGRFSLDRLLRGSKGSRRK
jgi:putative oxidoreductase